MSEQVRGRVHVEGPRCPFCRDEVRPTQDKEACKSCMAWLHAECWSEGGGCASCGARCARPPALARPFFCLGCSEPKPASAASSNKHLCQPCLDAVPPGFFFCYRCRAYRFEAQRGSLPGLCGGCSTAVRWAPLAMVGLAVFGLPLLALLLVVLLTGLG